MVKLFKKGYIFYQMDFIEASDFFGGCRGVGLNNSCCVGYYNSCCVGYYNSCCVGHVVVVVWCGVGVVQ